jgi:hypothetical protein
MKSTGSRFRDGWHEDKKTPITNLRCTDFAHVLSTP